MKVLLWCCFSGIIKARLVKRNCLNPRLFDCLVLKTYKAYEKGEIISVYADDIWLRKREVGFRYELYGKPDFSKF